MAWLAKRRFIYFVIRLLAAHVGKQTIKKFLNAETSLEFHFKMPGFFNM